MTADEARIRLVLESAECQAACVELRVYANALEKLVETGTDEQVLKIAEELNAADPVTIVTLSGDRSVN